jgi:hypothetical protein
MVVIEGRFLPYIDADIRIQKEFGAYSRPFHRCGGVSFLPSGKMSSGRLANISKARTIGFESSRRTISLPLRNISTSLLFRRNFLGNLTAWPLPDLNTLALAIFPPYRVYDQ